VLATVPAKKHEDIRISPNWKLVRFLTNYIKSDPDQWVSLLPGPLISTGFHEICLVTFCLILLLSPALEVRNSQKLLNNYKHFELPCVQIVLYK